MSLSYEKLEPVLVRDPLTIIEEKPSYAILKGGNQVSYKQYTTTSISSSNITFSCPPPSGNVFVDRKIFFLLPVRLVINSPGVGATDILLANEDAPRAFPLSGSIETMNITINGQSFSIFMSDMIHALSHYNTDQTLHNTDYSMTPTYYDQSQNYNDLILSIRNSLGTYSNGLDHSTMPRGGFPFTVVSRSPTQAVVDMVLVEPLWISPLYWGHGNDKALYNVTTMDFNFVFLTTGNRFWSHSTFSLGKNPISSIQAYFSNFTSVNPAAFSYSYNQPLLLFKYITPDSIQTLSPNVPITYPYFDIQRYPLDFSAAVGNNIVNSNNLQLNSIPRMMYVFARRSNNDLYSAIGSTYTDTFLSIESLNITFSNYTGLLSSASKYQLYQMAVKNGCGLSWTQWSGDNVYNSSGFSASSFGTVGSVLAVEFATDIGLPSDMAPGLQGQFNLQVTITFKNNSGAPMNATLYIIIVSEGSMTIPGLNAMTKQLGVISKEDILDAQKKHGVSYDEVREVPFHGGNFLSNLKNFGQNLNKALKETKIISEIAKEIPLPGVGLVGRVASHLGYGDQQRGGVVVDQQEYNDYYGGKMLHRNDLEKRLMKARGK